MGLADNGRTTIQPYDYDSAISERWDPIEQIGRSQSNYVQEAAQRRLAQQQAQQQEAMNAANAQSNSTANSNNAGIQNAGRTGGGGSTATGSFGKFMNSISSKESGNNYGARNGLSGAMGKYQIMPANLAGSAGWDMEALGYNISSSQFMASPQLQEQIAQFKLQQYYNKYGPAGAAIAWYAGPGAAQKYVNSGSASTRGEAGGHPSVSQYMSDILRRMGLG